MFVIKTKKPVVVLLRQDNGQRTTDNGQRTTEGEAGSQLTAHSLSLPFLPSVPLYTFYPLSTFAFSP